MDSVQQQTEVQCQCLLSIHLFRFIYFTDVFRMTRVVSTHTWDKDEPQSLQAKLRAKLLALHVKIALRSF